VDTVKSVSVQRIKEMLVVHDLSIREIQERFPHLQREDVEKALSQTSRKATP
jgi:uncharacterized protein (DUF433 family)